jgi:hypothetical protein
MQTLSFWNFNVYNAYGLGKIFVVELKSDYRYSKDIVYNNFPWPENPTEKQIKAIEDSSTKSIGCKSNFQIAHFSDLYDPLTMPPALVKAHNELDKAVDLAYRHNHLQPKPTEWSFYLSFTKNIRQIYLQKRKYD